MGKINRREFLAGTVKIAAAGMCAGISRNAFTEELPETTIAVASGKGASAVRAAVEALGGMKKFVSPGAFVVLKPNIAFPNPPKWGTTTSPEVVRTVAELCLEAGAKRVFIVDNPLGGAPMKNVERSGIGEAVADLKEVKIAMMTERQKYSVTENSEMGELKTVETMRILAKADVLINIPTAKAHNQTGVSLGLKNLMGLIWDRKVFHQEMNINRAIGELAVYIRPKLTIMDASRALLNNGPTGPGTVQPLDKVIVGTDPVAVDTYTLTLAEFNFRRMTAEQVPHLKHAEILGVGTTDLGRVKALEV